MTTYQEILRFWFEEVKSSQWWAKDEEFDGYIRKRFLKIHTKAVRCELFSWRATSSGALAEIIVIDQFSRNMFRDTTQAFAYDSLALALAQNAVACDFDSKLSPKKRSFVYMPYMHSESKVIHEVAEKLFSQPGLEEALKFEKRHRAIIEKFGRYPHRNTILSRASTPEEEAFLRLSRSNF